MGPRVVVVGSGLVGTCVAVRLAQRGADVTLLDAGTPGEGTTGTSFAWVGASHPSLAPYVELNINGVDAWRRLGAQLSDPAWLALSGTLTWESEPQAAAALERQITTLRELGYPCEELTAAQARALEPDLLLGAKVELVAHYPAAGYLFTRPALADLLVAGEDAGLRVRAGSRVRDFQTRADTVCGVTLASGEQLDADIVVSCVGRWSEELLGRLGLHLPMISAQPAGSPAVGLLVTTTPVLARLARVVVAGGLMVRPDGAGRLLLHGDEQDTRVREDTEPWPVPAPALELVTLLQGVLRNADTARVQSAQIGIRALPADHLPVVGSMQQGLYVVATHSGVTLAALLGELVAEELIDERQTAALERFRPARFERTAA
jgi:glycine/D-amino acid oxidase-like deaminating enzyme